MSIVFECTDPIPINFELYKLKQIFFPSQAPNRLYRLCIISPSAALWKLELSTHGRMSSFDNSGKTSCAFSENVVRSAHYRVCTANSHYMPQLSFYMA